MSRTLRSLLTLVGTLFVLPPLTAAQVPPDEYLRFVPLLPPRIVSQTDASATLHLYGDASAPAYRDDAPRDGIDDARGRRLHELATRFAPLMVRNTALFPIDFRTFYEQPSFLLHVDRWDVTRHDVSRMAGDQIDLARTGREACADGVGDSDDCRLVALLRQSGPEQPMATTRAAERETLPLLYVDLPGGTEKTWKVEYGPARRARYLPAARVYAHPFLAAATGPDGLPADEYELVLQYWFFYPMNDGPNNHEGDWEHINVVVSPRSSVMRRLSAAEIETLLATPDGDDALVIRRVEYYFHHFVTSLDFGAPNAYASRDEWSRQVDEAVASGRGSRKLWSRVRERAWRDAGETAVNTRPIVWIGGDGIGVQTVLEMPGLRDRDGHASHPFRGYYKRIGPGNVGERVLAPFDHQAYFADPSGQADLVEDYGAPARVALTPDWERIAALVRTDPAVRRDWAWLVLPMRFGYPASPSPVAGFVRHSDMGNVSVVGPAYNDGWNRVGESRGYERYDLVETSWARPMGFTDSFFPRLGFFNAPIVYFLVKPPLDLAWRTVALPVRAAVSDRQPTFLPASLPAERLVSVEAGPLFTTVPDDFLALFFTREQFPELAARLADALPAGASDVRATPRFGATAAPVYALTFHLSPRLSAESALTLMRKSVGFDVTSPQLAAPIQTRGDLQHFEFQGTFRYNLKTGPLQPYVKLGNGLTWYQLRNVSVAGQRLSTPNSPRFQPASTWRSLWFNETVLGAGLDWHRLRLGRTWLGVKASYTVVHHNLGFERDAAVEQFPSLATLVAGTTFSVWRQQGRVLVSVGF